MPKPTTLTDFLLARIAEDEGEARTPGVASVAAPNGLAVLDTDPDILALVAAPSRVLAECEAKRQIVEDNRDCTWGCDDEPNCHNCITIGRLAAVYADHPDYREEWRP